MLLGEVLLAEPSLVNTFDVAICSLEDVKGVDVAPFNFDIAETQPNDHSDDVEVQTVSGFVDWFTDDFKSRTNGIGKVHAPNIKNPAHLTIRN